MAKGKVKQPLIKEYKEFNKLKTYRERLEYLYNKGISLWFDYVDSKNAAIYLTPKTVQEKELLNEYLLLEVQRDYPEYTFEDLKESFISRMSNLPVIMKKDALLQELSGLNDRLNAKSIKDSYLKYKKGNEREFYRRNGFGEIIGHQIVQYEAYLKEELELIENQTKFTGRVEYNPPDKNKKIIKLTWNGRKNQLIDVLRQLKEKGLIDNTYEELTEFLKTHCHCFENTKPRTIFDLIRKKDVLHTKKKIKLDLNAED